VGSPCPRRDLATRLNDLDMQPTLRHERQVDRSQVGRVA
jgi:hypothetical protein